MTHGYFLFENDGPFEKVEHAKCAICHAVVAIRRTPVVEHATTQVLRTIEIRTVTAVEALLYDLVPGQKIQGYFCSGIGEQHYQKPPL